MKIFGIGAGRTGTLSLTQAMKMLGYNARHNVRQLIWTADIDFAADHLIAAHYKFLDAHYPGSKFIVTLRETSEILDSFERFYKIKRRKRARGFYLRYARFSMYGTLHFDRKLWGKAIERHYAEIKEHFSGRDDALYLDICGGEGWEKLCPFLGKEIPGVAFPWTHQT